MGYHTSNHHIKLHHTGCKHSVYTYRNQNSGSITGSKLNRNGKYSDSGSIPGSTHYTKLYAVLVAN